MEKIMLLTLFFLGVVIILCGLFGFIWSSIKNRSSDGGVEIVIGKRLTIKVAIASLAFTLLGSFLAFTAFAARSELDVQNTRLDTSRMMISNKERELEQASDLSGSLIGWVLKRPPATRAEGPSAEELGAHQDLQSRLLDDLRRGAQNEEFALSLLQALSTNSFGSLEIPADLADELATLLNDISRRHTDHAMLQVEVADAYRSLFHATDDEEYRKRWGELAGRLPSMAKTDEEQFYAFQIAGLYHQSLRDLPVAQGYLERAAEKAPDFEEYKIRFNLCNNLLYLERLDEALQSCSRSSELASRQGLAFWQPWYNTGRIYEMKNDVPRATDAFLEAGKVATRRGEGDLLASYLRQIPIIEQMCTGSTFRLSFQQICSANPDPAADSAIALGPEPPE